MINDINNFRIECAKCGKFQDLPHNPSIWRVEIDADIFFWSHQGIDPAAKTLPPTQCEKSNLFIRTFSAEQGDTFSSVAQSLAKGVEIMHDKKYGTSNHP